MQVSHEELSQSLRTETSTSPPLTSGIPSPELTFRKVPPQQAGVIPLDTDFARLRLRDSQASIDTDSETGSQRGLREFREQEERIKKDLVVPRDDTEGEGEQLAFLPPSSSASHHPSHSPSSFPVLKQLTRLTSKSPPKSTISSGGNSDSFSDLSDASVSKSALEEALADHLTAGGSSVDNGENGGRRMGVAKGGGAAPKSLMGSIWGKSGKQGGASGGEGSRA
jgi:hypothetical protein